jgi:ABC-type ATPase with predicted acetyltransferase domain
MAQIRQKLETGRQQSGGGLPEPRVGRKQIVKLAVRRRVAAPRASERVVEVCTRFGLVPAEESALALKDVPVVLGQGRIVLVAGPSGAGKSSLLTELAKRRSDSRSVNEVRFYPEPAVIDQVMPGEGLIEVVRLLTGCALGEPRLWLRRFGELSAGEQFRAKLARAIGRQRRGAVGSVLLCDEFCAVLDRRTARAIAYNLRRQVSRLGLCVVVATTHQDLEADLQPDQIIRLARGGAGAVVEREPLKRAMSLTRRMRVERGRVGDYRKFAEMHYRERDELAFVDRVFVLREGIGGEAVGVVVYAYPPLELSLRNRITAGKFVKNPQRLNSQVRILRRLVVVPELRGCGLGRLLVRRTLPLVGTRYVECLANLGHMNPVFEKAGMRRVGTCPAPKSLARLDAELRELGVDPLSVEFPGQVARRPRVRRVAARVVYQWYCGLTNSEAAAKRVRTQSAEVLARTYRQLVGSRPVYYWWDRQSSSRESARLERVSDRSPAA